MGICVVAECNTDAIAKGLCPKHYGRMRRNGDVEIVKMRGRFCQPDCDCGRHEQDEDHRRKNSEGNRGHVVSDETRLKLSVANTGRRAGRPAAGRFIDRSGYVRLTMEDEHPLASRVGHLLEARKVLYDKIGPGSHLCHWGCGRLLEWGGSTGICADHVDGNRINNDPENIVPSCNPCNGKRASLGNPTDWSSHAMG